MSKNYLVTGGAGFIGSNYVSRLLGRGENVTVYDNLSRRGCAFNIEWLRATYGADSFAGRLASVMQGSTETTFYVLAVYFGAVNIQKTRYAVTCGLIADAAGLIAAIFVSYLFFH